MKINQCPFCGGEVEYHDDEIKYSHCFQCLESNCGFDMFIIAADKAAAVKCFNRRAVICGEIMGGSKKNTVAW